MANGGLLETYLSRFGVPAEGISVETVGFAAALDAVARIDPSVAQSLLQELADQRSHLKLRQRKLRQPGSAVGDGQLALRQVRRGRSGSPALRRVRQR
jgi:hypothetical protein